MAVPMARAQLASGTSGAMGDVANLDDGCASAGAPNRNLRSLMSLMAGEFP
jgi:hypothetical protein